jgi:GntR family phosphonate transport system transcriptional regulator
MTGPSRRSVAKPGDAAVTAAAGVTLWRRIADGLERSIADGTYPGGSKLPGEMEIAMRYGVNRHTVRRAILALAERGLVRAERGSGTYVEARRIAYPIRSRTRFSEIVGTSGRAADGRLIASREELADADLAQRLRLKQGAPLVRIDTLRSADRTPICVGTLWFPASRFPDAARIYREQRSITKTLAQFQVTDYRRMSTSITAALADASDAMWLKLEAGQPILIVESVDIGLDRRPVLAARARFAADRIEFVVET